MQRPLLNEVLPFFLLRAEVSNPLFLDGHYIAVFGPKNRNIDTILAPFLQCYIFIIKGYHGPSPLFPLFNATSGFMPLLDEAATRQTKKKPF